MKISKRGLAGAALGLAGLAGLARKSGSGLVTPAEAQIAPSSTPSYLTSGLGSVKHRLLSGAANSVSTNPNNLAPSSPSPNWSASTAYQLGMGVTNGGNTYVCQSAGTSAASGGPAGTSLAPIGDGGSSITFTGALNSATSGTLTAPQTNGSYIILFSDGSIRYATITGTTAVSWAAQGAVTATAAAFISPAVWMYDGPAPTAASWAPTLTLANGYPYPTGLSKFWGVSNVSGVVANGATNVYSDSYFAFGGGKLVNTGTYGGYTVKYSGPCTVKIKYYGSKVCFDFTATTGGCPQFLISPKGGVAQWFEPGTRSMAGNPNFFTLAFPYVDEWDITCFWNGAATFLGVFTAPTDTIMTPSSFSSTSAVTGEAVSDASRPRIWFDGDSYLGGSSNSPLVYRRAMYLTVAFSFGADFGIDGVGGSGYITPGPNNKTMSNSARIAALADYAPDFIFALAGVNDNGNTASAETAAVKTWWQNVRAISAAPIIVGGAFGATTGPSAAILTVETGIQNAVTQIADPLTVFMPISSDTTPWFYGTGYDASPNASGNTDFLVGPDDTTHPSHLGGDYLGRRIFGSALGLVATLPMGS